MIYRYKCTWADNVQTGFTVGKIYAADTEKETFLDDYNNNWWEMICKSNNSCEINPEKWRFHQRKFTMISNNREKKIIIKCDDNKVVAKKGNQTGEAVCHKDDKFDYYTGAKLALDRLFGKNNNDINEHEKYSYKLGDKVRIINPGLAYTSDVDFFDRNCKYHFDYKDWVKKYAYEDDLGYFLRLKNKYLYNELYDNKRYIIVFIHDSGQCVIEDCETGAIYIVHKNGLEKVNS